MGAADAIREELKQMNAESVSPGMAAVAVELALAFDGTDAATSKAVTARELSAVMTKLRALAKPDGKGGAVDELNRRRDARRAQQRQRAAEGG